MQTFGILLFCCLLGQQGSAQTANLARRGALQPGDYNRILKVGEVQRSYILHVPAKYDPKRKTPVVLALHGATMTGAMMQILTGLDELSDRSRFVVVYPNGTGPTEILQTWNSGGFAPLIAKNKPDDVAFIGKVLDDVESLINVDRKRVFACGLSNGGMMCYRLASEMSDRIAAIASVAGTMAIEKCEPKRPVPVLHFHGTEDRLVPFGGPGRVAASVLKFAGVEDCIAAWVKANLCKTEPEVCVLPSEQDKLEVTRRIYSGGKSGADVVLYIVRGGGHTWPGRAFGGGLLGAFTNNIQANELIWDFFQRHPMQ